MPPKTPLDCNFPSSSQSAGETLPSATSSRFEDFFAADLASVKIIVCPEPARLGALAFAYGERVFVTPEFAPDCQHGLGVLAHELTHVLQQRAGMASASSSAGPTLLNDQRLEVEAERARTRWQNGARSFNLAGLSLAAAGGAPVVQCLQFHGELSIKNPQGKFVGTGKFGVLSADQIKAWVDSKSNRIMNPANISQCVTYLQGHNGMGGGGFGNYTYKGHQVFHISHGQQGSNQGCTLMFAMSSPGVATIVAIGYHQDSLGPHGTPRYFLDWVKDGWHRGNLIW
jgi:hypothetical protein